MDLSAVRVLDMTRFIAGPYCGTILADMGAQVAKVETSKKGDPGRAHPPIIKGESLYHQVVNRNKLGLYLDLRTDQGRERFRELLAKADVLIENFRPGTLEEMGFPWETLREINPRLILARISGVGQKGPGAEKPYFDVIAQAMSGIMSLTGAKDGPPMRSGVYLSDYLTGIYTALGIFAALYLREKTGRGQVVEVSLLDSLISLLHTAIPEYKMLGVESTRSGNRDRYSSPSSAYQTADGDWIFIAAGNDIVFPKLASALGNPDLVNDPRFNSMSNRLANFDALETLVTAEFARHGTAEMFEILQREGLPCAKINSLGEMLETPEANAPGRLVSVDHPVLGAIPMQGFAVKLSDSPPEIRRCAPAIGEHNEQIVREWLGK